MVMKRIGPELFKVPSTFRTGSGVRRVRRVRELFLAKVESIIIPSMPLSRRALALIVLPDCVPMRRTLRVTEGDRIFRMVPLGTGSESRVSRKVTRRMEGRKEEKGVREDSVTAGLTRNPGRQDRDRGCRRRRSRRARDTGGRPSGFRGFLLLRGIDHFLPQSTGHRGHGIRFDETRSSGGRAS